MKKFIVINLIFSGIILFTLLPAHAGWSPHKEETSKDQNILNEEVAEAVAAFKNTSPVMNDYFENAYGYVVFPGVGKGGFGIGGAYGHGEVYEKGEFVGFSTLKQVSFGLQFGGQKYSEIIFFKDKENLEDFKKGNYELGASASAVAITAGVSTDADYNDGVAIFTLVKGGLMYEASVSGQKFTFKPK
ncbi:MAG: lipid-binding SYLF domain-containing protein [Candidatus Kuenenia sp.]|nr:lipid-binding SYLF domain-containing protein [Candidatus Kuenenia hertensis]